jgi:hypothetical protein
MKKHREDEPIGVKYMYTWKYHKKTPCVATFISNMQKSLFFCIFLFSSAKPENRKVERLLQKRGVCEHQWDGGRVRESGRIVIMAQKMCTHVLK